MTRIAFLLFCSFLLPTGYQTHAQSAGTTNTVRSADGVTIHYDVHGSGQPALVLIHGWTNARRIWGRHPETLSQFHQVVNIDLAGHGASGADRSAWTTEAFTEDVAAVVTALGLDQIVLVGFSMGGSVALAAAERLPEETIGIVMVDALHDPDVRPTPEEIDQLAEQIRTNWRDPAFLRAFGFTPDAPDSLIEYVQSIAPLEPQDHWFDVLRGNVEWREHHRNAVLKRTAVPIALLNATLRPTNMARIHNYNADVVLDTLNGVGHAGMLLQRVEDFDAKLLRLVDEMVEARSER